MPNRTEPGRSDSSSSSSSTSSSCGCKGDFCGFLHDLTNSDSAAVPTMPHTSLTNRRLGAKYHNWLFGWKCGGG